MKKITTILFILMIGSIFAFAQKERKVIIKTNYGKIKLKLYNETPQHRDNFVKLAKEGFYDGTIFHRVIPEFMIQGGDPESKNADSKARLGSGGPDYKVPAEIVEKYYHKKGALAAARQGDSVNPEKASSGSQFYIVVGKTMTEAELNNLSMKTGVEYTDEQKEVYSTQGGTPFLDQNYTVFGELTKGMEVIEKIALVKRNSADRPDEDVVMLKVKVK